MSLVPSNSHRIALCITDLEPGGAERMLTELALGLRGDEFQPHVFVLMTRPAPGRDILAVRLEQAGIPLHFLGAERTLSVPWLVLRLSRELAHLRPEIVQSFLWHANCAATVAARRAGVPNVLTGIRVAERRANLHLWTARWLVPLVDYHVCVSQSVARFSTSVGQLPPERLVVIPNGVDVGRFPALAADRREFGVGKGRRILLSIGRLEPQKGIDWLVALAPRILGPLPEHDLVIVGDGPQRESLVALSQKQGLADRIHVLGPRADAANILATAELLILPSRWEGMPNVVLEAMASAKPIVACRVEGVEEIVGVESSYQLADPGDADQLVDQIVALAGAPWRAAEIGQENRRFVERNFLLREMIEAYRGLYRDILAGVSPVSLFRN